MFAPVLAALGAILLLPAAVLGKSKDTLWPVEKRDLADLDVRKDAARRAGPVRLLGTLST